MRIEKRNDVENVEKISTCRALTVIKQKKEKVKLFKINGKKVKFVCFPKVLIHALVTLKLQRTYKFYFILEKNDLKLKIQASNFHSFFLLLIHLFLLT